VWSIKTPREKKSFFSDSPNQGKPHPIVGGTNPKDLVIFTYKDV